MTLKLLAEHHLEFLSLKGGCTGSSESHMSKCHNVGNHMSRLKFRQLDPWKLYYCKTFHFSRQQNLATAATFKGNNIR